MALKITLVFVVVSVAALALICEAAPQPMTQAEINAKFAESDKALGDLLKQFEELEKNMTIINQYQFKPIKISGINMAGLEEYKKKLGQ